MMFFTQAIKPHHLSTIETLANTIWQEHYTPIIGEAQVAYMLNKFQSFKKIEQQTLEGYRYYLIETNVSTIGYLCVKKTGNSLFLSKLYVLKSERGNGYGKKALHFVETIAKNLNCESINLTVNKNNTSSIKAYEQLGFINIGAIVIDIGNGFVMDDFKMQKRVLG